MTRLQKVAVALAAAVLGAIGVSAPAHAYDTNWPCAGCVKTGQP